MCVISSDLPQVVDRTEYLNCENIEVLKGIFRQCFKMKDSKYQDYNSVSARPITLDSFPTVYQTKIKINQDNTSLSKKKLRKIINRIIVKHPLLISREKEKHTVDHLVAITMQKIRKKASSKVVRDIITKNVKRRLDYLLRTRIEITYAQKCSLNIFCKDCKDARISNKSGHHVISLCKKHRDNSEAIIKMLDDDEKHYCPTCKTLGHFYDNIWHCPDDDCRTLRFHTA